MGEIVDRGFPFFFHFFCRALNRLTEQPMGVTSLTDGFHQHTHNQPKKSRQRKWTSANSAEHTTKPLNSLSLLLFCHNSEDNIATGIVLTYDSDLKKRNYDKKHPQQKETQEMT